MLARLRSAAVLGIEAYPVEVEVDLSNGLPSFSTVGLPHGAVKEGRERVTAALVNTGFEFPLSRITVNLAPADVRKEGSAFDLPIALGVLAASGQLPAAALERQLFLGELGLQGDLRTRSLPAWPSAALRPARFGRLLGRAWPAGCQARARGGGGGRPQSAAGWASRGGEDNARAPPPFHSAGAHPR
jgi:hypothetical protein